MTLDQFEREVNKWSLRAGRWAAYASVALFLAVVLYVGPAQLKRDWDSPPLDEDVAGRLRAMDDSSLAIANQVAAHMTPGMWHCYSWFELCAKGTSHTYCAMVPEKIHNCAREPGSGPKYYRMKWMPLDQRMPYGASK